jgi:hypothetical protein
VPSTRIRAWARWARAFDGLQRGLEEAKKKQAEQAQKAKDTADAVKKGAEEQEKQATEAKETAKQLPYVLEGVHKVVGASKDAGGNFSQIKTTAEEMPGVINAGATKLKEENELLKIQIRHWQEIARLSREAASSGGGGVKSFTPGMKYGGPVLPILGAQHGETIPGFGGGDKHIRALEGGEEVLDKYTARYARQHGILDALRQAAGGGGIGQQRGYHIIDFRVGEESHPLKVIEDEEVVEAFVRGLQRSRMTKGIF